MIEQHLLLLLVLQVFQDDEVCETRLSYFIFFSFFLDQHYRDRCWSMAAFFKELRSDYRVGRLARAGINSRRSTPHTTRDLDAVR